MGSFGGYYKGEKKKEKKGKGIKPGGEGSNAPVFVQPEVVSKKKSY